MPAHGDSTRKLLLTLAAGALWPRLGDAQPARRIPKVAVLWHAGSAEEEGPYYTVLQEAFKNLGYENERTIALEHRFPNEEPAKFESMAVELVSWKPDVLLAANVSSAIATKKATSTIPIVFDRRCPSPMGSQLVDNLARPSGNLTGLQSLPAVEVTKKRLEFLKSAIPSLSRVALLINPNVP